MPPKLRGIDGRCIDCAHKHEGTGRRCPRCLSRNRESARRIRHDRVARGRCWSCGRRARTGHLTCSACAAAKAARSRKQAAIRRAAMLAAKSKPCKDCGVCLPPEVMDLDHVRGKKLFCIGSSPAQNKHTLKAVLAEIAKCDVRCPNCHRMRHYRERLTNKKVVGG